MLPAIGLLLAAAFAAPGSPMHPRLQVQMELEPGVTLQEVDLQGVATEARRIWAPVVDLIVKVPPASHPVAESIRLVLTNRTLDGHESTGLGWIEFVDGRPQPTITVSVAAARRLLQSGTWRGKSFAMLPPRASLLFLQRALARAVAHEVGHYMLRTKAHDRRGLMQASFTVDEIMDRPARLDRLAPDAVARLLQPASLVARAAGDTPGTEDTRAR
jgi:hypothetical protein